MSVTAPPPTQPDAGAPPDRATEPAPSSSRTNFLVVGSVAGRVRGAGRWLLAVLAAMVAFALFLLAKGADPLEVYEAMWTSASADGFGETLIRATPFLLAGLAVAVPARAGLFNIGGEGQLLLGAMGAVLVARSLGPDQGVPCRWSCSSPAVRSPGRSGRCSPRSCACT